jgi:hypothetical protein
VKIPYTFFQIRKIFEFLIIYFLLTELALGAVLAERARAGCSLCSLYKKLINDR